jgi:hypothetical protein
MAGPIPVAGRWSRNQGLRNLLRFASTRKGSPSRTARPLPAGRSRAVACALLAAVAILTVSLAGAPGAGVTDARAATANATLTNPVNGTQYFDPTRAFTWNPVSDATGYWLWVGTSPGANDVVNSKMLSGTSYVAKSLPTGRTLYARLWTYRGNVAANAPDVAFTAAPGLSFPTNGAQYIDSSRPFTWNGDPAAISYRLKIGTTQGASDLADSGLTSATSYAPPGLPANRTLWARLTTQYAATTVTSDVSFTAAVRTATISAPSSGASGVDPVRPITWSQPGGADAYWLWLGTSPGASDVASSKQIPDTSYVAAGQPPGRTLYARLWTLSGNLWASAPDVTYTATSGLSFPANAAVNVDTSRPFTWPSDPSATSYRLTVGTSAGASDVTDSGQVGTTSYTVPGVPAGRTLYARLTTYHGLASTTSDSTFSAKVRTAQLTSPTAGAVHVDPATGFNWDPVGGADGYWLWVGTTPGGSDLVNSGQLSGTSYRPSSDLPAGKTLYAKLWTLNNGFWDNAPEISFTVAPKLTNPTNGAQDVDTTKPFTWTADAQATSYRLTVGASQGGSELVDSGQISGTSFSVPGLPAGKTLWARLTTRYGTGATATTDVSFTARVRAATLTSPKNGDTNIDATKPFTWNATGGADAYWLWIGTSPGSNDVVDSGEIAGTSYTSPTTLLPNKTYYAKLWTRSGNIWADAPDVQFTAIVGATTITSPDDGAVGVDPLKPISWKAVPGADSYWLWIGTSQGSDNLVSTGQITSTSYVPQGLPPGQKLWARVYTIAGKQVPSKDVSFAVSPSLAYPKDGAQGVDATKPFTWASDPAATSYRLTIGTTKGAGDLLDSGQITTASYPVHGLPAGSTLWARLTTTYGSSSTSSDISFAVSPSFKYPATGSLGVDRSTPFKWSAAAGANGATPHYRLLVGSTPGGNDLYDSGSITGTSASVPAAALPSDRTLYARVNISPGDGSTVPADTVFTVAGSAAPSVQMSYPTDGAANVDTSEPFRWTYSPLAEAYRLKITQGGNVVKDSGVVQVDRYVAEDLATGSYGGTLEAKFAGQWQTQSSFSFTVTSTGSSMAKEVSMAQHVTDSVRGMADNQSYPYPWTPLYTQVHDHGDAQAICSDFAPQLVDLLDQTRVAQRLPGSQQPDGIDIGFMNNGVDVHTLVKIWNTDTNGWMLLDPMFDLSMKRASDGQWASPQDMNDAAVTKSWSSIQYVQLGSVGDYFARNYYIDYPLLYLNLDPTPVWRDPKPYMTAVSPPSGTTTATYAISSDHNPVTVLVNGKSVTMNIAADTGLSGLFTARTIALPAGSPATIQVYRLNRAVF